MTEIIVGIVGVVLAWLLFGIFRELCMTNKILASCEELLERLVPPTPNPFTGPETWAERYLKMQKQVQKEVEQRAAEEAEQ